MPHEEVHELLSSWFASQRISDVSFRETFPSVHDPADDYKVVYEAVFEPQSLDKARVEMWVTDRGHVAIGLETRERIAARLNVTNYQKGFAAGYEPRALSQHAILTFLKIASGGNILLRTRTILGILDGIRAEVPAENYKALQVAGIGGLDWIGIAQEQDSFSRFGVSSTLIQFRSWPN